MIEEKVKKIIEKIDLEDGKIKAFIEVYRSDALTQAKELDSRKDNKKGKLFGKIIAIKNNIAIRGKRFTCGSKMLESYISPYDSSVIERIRAEDGIIIGSLNMDEFACGSDNSKSAFFATKNPLDVDYVPGGSSGASAAAVAAGFCDIALGSDTGGSIRCPASFCGVISIKPTYGLVSRFGLGDLAMSFDQIGPIAKTVEENKLMLEVIAGKDEKDQTTFDSKGNGEIEVEYKSERKPTIAIAKEFLEGLDPQILKEFSILREKLTQKGYSIVEVSIPMLKYAIPIYYLAVFAEFSSAMQRYDGLRYGKVKDEIEDLVETVSTLRGEKFGSEVKRRIMLGSFITTKEYQDAWYGKTLRAREILKNEINEVLEKYDLLLGPTMPCLPWKIGQKSNNPLEMYLTDILTVPANIAGIPAGSVPFGKIGNLRPGFQVQAKKFGEAKVIRLMKEIEELDKS